MLKNWRISLVLIPLLVAAGVRAAEAGPIGYTVGAHTNGHLWSIDLDRGTIVTPNPTFGLATDLGEVTPTIGDDGDGLAFIGSTLYMVTGGTGSGADQLWKIDPNGSGDYLGGNAVQVCTLPTVGCVPPGLPPGPNTTGPRVGGDSGLDSYGGVLYNVSSDLANPSQSQLYTLDLTTGVATSVGAQFPRRVDGLAVTSGGQGYAVDGAPTGVGQFPTLFKINIADGVLSEPKLLGANYSGSLHTGLAFDSAGTLWMTTSAGGIFTIDLTTGLASAITQAYFILPGDPTQFHYNLNGTEGLAIGGAGSGAAAVPEPATLALVGLGFVAMAAGLRRRAKQ